jgi:histone-binding protein RBBP4
MSTSEDNIVMVWQPTARVWAAETVKVDEKELEEDEMDVEDDAAGNAERPAKIETDE